MLEAYPYIGLGTAFFFWLASKIVGEKHRWFTFFLIGLLWWVSWWIFFERILVKIFLNSRDG